MMRDTSSRFVEHIDTNHTNWRVSDSDVRLEDVLAAHEAYRRRSSTQSQSSSESSLGYRFDQDNSALSSQRWKKTFGSIFKKDGKPE